MIEHGWGRPTGLALVAILVGLGPMLAARTSWADDDEECLLCHGVKGMRSGPKAIPVPYVDVRIKAASAHEATHCIECHVGVENDHHPEGVPRPECDGCHQAEAAEHRFSVHGKGLAKGMDDVPDCIDCHGTHDIRRKGDTQSKVYPLNLPDTCGRCHSDETLAARHTIEIENPYRRYLTGAHGRGLLKSGLLVSATCNDCHGTHDILPHEDGDSRIARKNVAATCAECHAGVLEDFRQSIHGRELASGNDDAPTCIDCHSAHENVSVQEAGWRLALIAECGSCHEDLLETYHETYHGQVTSLGYTTVARCSDCHGSHAIREPEDRRSTLSRENIVATCQKCHPRANANFARFIAHPDHHDREEYPILFYPYIAMTALLIGVFSFFGLHTLLWFFRLWRSGSRPLKEKSSARTFMRFSYFERVLHGMVIVSFMLLVLTGIPLKFSYTQWASVAVRWLGGFETAGFLHRVGAVVTFLYFALHLVTVTGKVLRRERGIFWGPDSMVPNLGDFRDMLRHVKWFLGLGPRPEFDRWTYWEKFDYWAVFWGVAIIGASGLILWFPTAFALVLPGWMANIAMIVHSDEALMAAGFIFSIHFFNSHFRPDKFPVDPVIFTGRISLEELAHERPRELARLEAAGALEKRMVEPVREWEAKAARTFGLVALGFGLLLLALIIVSALLG